MWFILQKWSFAGCFSSGWAHGKTRPPANTTNIITQLLNTATRLSKTQIENRDFRDVIKTYDGPNTLFYCDPPYCGSEAYYEGKTFTQKDHEDLARLLHNIQGKVILSYEPHPKILELYTGWEIVSREVTCHSYVLTTKTQCNTRPHRQEALFFNFTPTNTSKNQSNITSF
jgi:DNA adenine methylase